jgi:hypothetical protein
MLWLIQRSCVILGKNEDKDYIIRHNTVLDKLYRI